MKLTHSKKILASVDTGMEYWYFTRHGIGPGTIPKDTKVIRVVNDGWDTYMLLDRMLTTDELNFFDLKEKAPSEELLAKEKVCGGFNFDDDSEDYYDPEGYLADEAELDSIPPFDYSQDTLIPVIENALNIKDEDAAKIIWWWYDNEDAWSDFDSPSDFASFLPSDIHNMLEACDDPEEYEKVSKAISACDSIYSSEIEKISEDDNTIEYIVSDTDVDSDSKLDTAKLEDDIREGIRKYFASPRGGWPEEELEQAIKDFTYVDIHRNEDDNATVVEVRAELSYDGLCELSEILDPIVDEYDPDAYFDMVTGGVMEAYIFDKAVKGCSAIQSSTALDDERAIGRHERMWLEPEDYDEPEELPDLSTDFDFDITVLVVDSEFSIEEGDPLYHASIFEDEGLTEEEMVEDFNDILAWHVPDADGTYHMTGHASLIYVWNMRREEYECNFLRSNIDNVETTKVEDIESSSEIKASAVTDVVDISVPAENVEVGDVIKTGFNDSELEPGTIIKVLKVNEPGEPWIDYTFNVSIENEDGEGTITDVHFDTGEPVGTIIVK